MESSYGGGLISFEFDETLLRQVEKTLGNLKGESRKCLKNAVNKTAKQAKKDLAKKAQETYVVKSTRMTKAMKTDSATTGNLTAVINVTGAPMELKDFKVSPASYRPQNPPVVVKAKVLQASGLKALQASSKAFVTQFASGHKTVAQRRGPARLPIKTLYSNSVPVMIGNEERVYGVVEPHIHENLMNNLVAEIKKVVSKA